MKAGEGFEGRGRASKAILAEAILAQAQAGGEVAVFSLCFTAFRDAAEMAPDAQRMVAEVDQGSPRGPSVWARPVRIYEAGRPRSSFARSHHPPEVTTADAMAEVQRLESAIAVLGESNPHAGPLLKSLQVAKSRSRAPPVAGRIEACKSFIERAKRRVVRAEEIIQRAQDQKDVCVAEVAAAEGCNSCRRSPPSPVHVALQSPRSEICRGRSPSCSGNATRGSVQEFAWRVVRGRCAGFVSDAPHAIMSAGSARLDVRQ